MALLLITKGYTTIVDDEDFERLNKVSWQAMVNTNSAGNISIRVGRNPGGKGLQTLSRYILGVTNRNVIVDHINGNTLDNRKVNLRIGTQKDNSRNKRFYRSVDRDIGIRKRPSGNWEARIKVDGVAKGLGTYVLKEEAIEAYRVAKLKYHMWPEEALKLGLIDEIGE